MTPESFFTKIPADQADEHTHQVALFCWAALNVGNDPRLQWLFAIPNGGERNKIVASRMKAEGVRSGVPDVMLPVPAPSIHDPDYGGINRVWYNGLVIEIKRPSARLKREPKHKWDTGGVSEDQIKWLNALEALGHKVVVCYHWYEAASEIKFYLTGRGLDNG